MLGMFLGVTHPVDLVLVPYAPQAAAHAQDRRHERHPVRRTVTHSALEALHVAGLVSDRVTVVYPAVQQVEYVARYHGCQSHRPPVLTQAVNAEAVRHKAGEDSKQHAVREARQPG